MENQHFQIITNVKKGERLDKFVEESLKDFSRNKINHFIKEGLILVNNQKKKSSYRLKENDVIFYSLKLSQEQRELISLPLISEPEILYEDNNCLVINKPAGINTHPTLKNINQPSIASWLLFKYPEIKNVGEDSLRPGIVHRLDKDTSGVLILAKNQQTFLYFKNLFSTRKIKKYYLVLIKGVLKKDEGDISFSLTRSKKFGKRKIVLHPFKDNHFKSALTHFRVKKRYLCYTLLEVAPLTGRTHQIRVHLASIGFPVAGDKLYGVSKKDKDLFPRQMLHAQKIIFPTFNGEILSIEAPLPLDFKNALLTIAKN